MQFNSIEHLILRFLLSWLIQKQKYYQMGWCLSFAIAFQGTHGDRNLVSVNVSNVLNGTSTHTARKKIPTRIKMRKRNINIQNCTINVEWFKNLKLYLVVNDLIFHGYWGVCVYFAISLNRHQKIYVDCNQRSFLIPLGEHFLVYLCYPFRIL